MKTVSPRKNIYCSFDSFQELCALSFSSTMSSRQIITCNVFRHENMRCYWRSSCCAMRQSLFVASDTWSGKCSFVKWLTNWYKAALASPSALFARPYFTPMSHPTPAFVLSPTLCTLCTGEKYLLALATLSYSSDTHTPYVSNGSTNFPTLFLCPILGEKKQNIFGVKWVHKECTRPVSLTVLLLSIEVPTNHMTNPDILRLAVIGFEPLKTWPPNQSSGLIYSPCGWPQVTCRRCSSWLID